MSDIQFDAIGDWLVSDPAGIFVFILSFFIVFVFGWFAWSERKMKQLGKYIP